MFHMSHVTCHMSRVICHMNFFGGVGQSGGANWWRLCYERGLPRLVLNTVDYNIIEYNTADTVQFLCVYRSCQHSRRRKFSDASLKSLRSC